MIFRQKSLRDRNTTEPTYIGGTMQQAWCLFSWITRLGFIEKKKLFIESPDEGVKVKKHYVYGLQGLCDLLGCSTATASRIKRSGVIDAAISQVGKIIVVDADLALDLIKAKKPHKRQGYNK